MTDRPRETRNAADVRNIVNAHPSLILASGCSGRLTNDSRTPDKGLEGGSVFVPSLTMIAKMAAQTAAIVGKGASHGGGRRYRCTRSVGGRN